MIIFKDPENRVGGWVVRFKKPGKPVIGYNLRLFNEFDCYYSIFVVDYGHESLKMMGNK